MPMTGVLSWLATGALVALAPSIVTAVAVIACEPTLAPVHENANGADVASPILVAPSKNETRASEAVLAENDALTAIVVPESKTAFAAGAEIVGTGATARALNATGVLATVVPSRATVFATSVWEPTPLRVHEVE